MEQLIRGHQPTTRLWLSLPRLDSGSSQKLIQVKQNTALATEIVAPYWILLGNSMPSTPGPPRSAGAGQRHRGTSQVGMEEQEKRKGVGADPPPFLGISPRGSEPVHHPTVPAGVWPVAPGAVVCLF